MGGLRDPEDGVREYTINLIAHLVLNDMMKIRGHVAEISALIHDPVQRIADLTGELLVEISLRKENGVFAEMPDVAKTLAMDDFVHTEEVISKLVPMFQNPKQVVPMTERIAERLRTEGDERAVKAIKWLMRCLKPLIKLKEKNDAEKAGDGEDGGATAATKQATKQTKSKRAPAKRKPA